MTVLPRLAAALAIGCGELSQAVPARQQDPAVAPGAQTPEAEPGPEEIVRRSVVNSERNWKEAPEFSYFERDITTSGGRTTDRTYQTMMIEGSPYQKLIAIDGRPLSAQQIASEEPLSADCTS